MQKLQTTLFYTILASEAGHVVCCVIPTVLSLLALAASYGVMVSIPGFALSIHEYMHEWEQTIIILSGLLLAFGWALHVLSKKSSAITIVVRKQNVKAKRTRQSLLCSRRQLCLL